ncbi:MAG: GAF domain-containing SpoIIE family protein phosphatase, partial [Nocardioides sp.]
MTDITAPDASFDRYARMVRRSLGVPVALVSLVEEGRQVFPGASGLPEPFRTTRETPLSHSFCQYVVADQRPLVIGDARHDDRLMDNLAIPDLGIVAYAGWPLTDHEGIVIGSLCAIDTVPHVWTAEELETLGDLAAACSGEIAQRELRHLSYEQAASSRRASRRSRVLLSLSEALSETRTYADIAEAVERVATEELHCLRAGLWLRAIADPAHISEPTTPPTGQDAETLRHVSEATREWDSTHRFDVLPLDETNPLGMTVLLDRPLFHASLRDVLDVHPHLAAASQLGQGRAYAPLRVNDQVYGALALAWDNVRDFVNDDRATVTALASYAAQALQRATLLQERVDAAATLQNAMLARLPRPDGLTLAARYRPAATRNRVGGDWYDASVMADGRTSLTVGDVVGHDLTAAANMGRLQNMLCALSWANPGAPPSDVVGQLDLACRDLGHDHLATLLHARLERETAGHVLHWTSAGHLPPLLVHPNGATEPIEGTSDLMLGVDPERRRSDQHPPLPAGATVLFFPDGLVERRGGELDKGLRP